MITQSITSTDIKPQIYQLVDQLHPDKLSDLLRFLEEVLKIINTHIVNNTKFNQHRQLPQTGPPSLKFPGMFKDDPNWEEFQAAIAEYRREVDATSVML